MILVEFYLIQDLEHKRILWHIVFMTEPLSVNDLTVAKKENLEGQEVNVEVSDEKKEVEEKRKHRFLFGLFQ